MITLDIFSTITITANIAYVYFYVWLIVSIINPNWFLKKTPKTPGTGPGQVLLVFQITTKGGNWRVIQRGIENIKMSNLDDQLYKILIVTESKNDIEQLDARNFGLKFLLVPRNYETLNRTEYKARGLHFAVENYPTVLDSPENTYIVHYDEESVIIRDNIPTLYNQINKAYSEGIDITCGPIYYPLEYREAAIFSRAMEANRAFVEPECAIGCITGLPKQGHGSNMIVRASVECATGWDIGRVDNHPIISEDILFLIQAKSAGAKFGWHGVPMIEQPAFTLDQSLKQRYRWVFGSLQALAVTKNLFGWDKLNKWEQFNMSQAIAIRCFSYSLGFLIGLSSLIMNFVLLAVYLSTGKIYWNFNFVSLLFLLMWIGAYQYGVYMNLKFTNYSLRYKIKEHILIFLLSPVAGLLETYPALRAVYDWYILRKRSVDWQPTKKTK